METKTIHIGITSTVLAALINSRLLHVADFECLDLESKRVVWELLLNALKTERQNSCLE